MAMKIDDLENDMESQPEPVPCGKEINDNHYSNALVVLVQDNNEEEVKKFTFYNYLHDPNSFIGRSYRKDSLKGFLSILSNIPRSKAVKILYKIGLYIFFFINFLYPIIVFSIEREHPTYNIVCSSISLVGLLYEIFNTLFFSYIKPWYEQRKSRRINPESIPGPSTPKNAFEDPEDIKVSAIDDDCVKDLVNTNKEPKEAVIEFIRDSVGELFIYPSIICGLFGFINERGWEFDSALAVFDFILLVYSFLTDVFNAKIIHIWNLVQIIKATYDKYDEYVQPDWTAKLRRHLSPFSLAIPYAVVQVLVHWLMLAIIGVRIYVDNFTRRINDTTEIETGDYKTTVYTRYMIFCGGYLLIASTFVYLILNKYWFFEIYSFIGTEKNHEIPLSVKLLAFVRDPIAYILVILQVVPFIPFAIGSFLPDYDQSEFDVAPGLRIAAQVLGWCFIGFFVVSNMQAVVICTCLAIVGGIIGTTIAMFAAVIAAILLGYLVIVLYYCLDVCCESLKDDGGDAVSFSGICEYTVCVGDSCKSFWSNFDAECVADCAFENLDLCFCTCDPDDA